MSTPLVRKIAVLCLILVPAFWLAWVSRDVPHLGHFHDDGLYWVSAKSIAEGSGYKILSLPSQPAQTKYPPLYPAMLAAVWKLGLPGALWITWIAFPLYLWLAWFVFARAGFGEKECMALVALAGLCPTAVYYSATLMPDIWFGALLFGAILFAQRDRPIAAGLLAGAAYLMKTMAAPLVLGVALWYLLRRDLWRAALYLAASLPAVIGWTLWSRAHLAPGADPVTLYYANYLGYHLSIVSLSDLPQMIWQNADQILRSFASLLIFNLADTYFGVHLSRLISIAAISGVVRLARERGLSPYHWFAICYAPILLLWHFPPGERFVMPMYPLLLAGLYVELRHFSALLVNAFRKGDAANRAVAACMGLAAAAVAIFAVTVTARALTRDLPGVNAQHRLDKAKVDNVYRWIDANLPKDANLFAYEDTKMFLETGRRACRFPVSPMAFYHDSKDELLRPYARFGEFLRAQRLNYLLFTATDGYSDLPEDVRLEARKAILAQPGVRPIHESDGFSVYEFRPELSQRADAARP